MKMPKPPDRRIIPCGSKNLPGFSPFFITSFRQGHRIAFEVLMALAFSHFFGFYNPKQLADFLDIPHQKLYAQLKDCSLYSIKKNTCPLYGEAGGQHSSPP